MYNQKNHQFDTFYNHKFGFHISGPRQDAFEDVFRLKPKVVKTLDFSVDVMRRMKQEIPDLFLIGRLFVHPQDFGQLSGGTARAARRKGIDMAERILREEVNQTRHHFNGQPLFNAWESLNEVFPEWSDDDTHQLFDEYQVAFGQKMLAAGFEPVAFNFGQGNGRGQQWLRLYPGTLEMYTYLGFHEYDWPTMDRLHRIGLNGPNEPQNRVPVVGQGRGNDGLWRCLRYRRIMYEGIRQKFGDKHTAIITECGMTQGVWGGPARDIGPWAEELTVPRDIPGGIADSPIYPQDYWQSLLWYNEELLQDDFLMGACLFVTGAAGLPDWETFEHLGVITDRIYALQKLHYFDNQPDPIMPQPTPLDPDEQDGISDNDASDAPEEDPNEDSGEDLPEDPAENPNHDQDDSPMTDPESAWDYTVETGQGLSLLVGDIGIAGERITITRPDNQRLQVISGSKSEYGLGGFEIYAHQPGNYQIEFLAQRFNLRLSSQFTRVTFHKNSDPMTPPTPPPARPDDKPPPTPPSEPQPISPPDEDSQLSWRYHIERGQGLGLLVGDIGISGETIIITRPDGRQERLISGSKQEYGQGGFEIYAQQSGLYQVQFLDQKFELPLTGQFTKVIFERNNQLSQATTAHGVASPPQSQPSDSRGLFKVMMDFITRLVGQK